MKATKSDGYYYYREKYQDEYLQITCKYCHGKISGDASKCKHCGESLHGKRSNYNNGVAAILSFLFPGVGQIYQERFSTGLLFLFFTPFGYLLFFVPGIIIHFFAIFDAAHYEPGPC